MNVLVVLHDHRDGVAFGQPGLPEEMRKPVGSRLQFGEADHDTRRVQDDGGFGGVDMLPDLHALNVDARVRRYAPAVCNAGGLVASGSGLRMGRPMKRRALSPMKS